MTSKTRFLAKHPLLGTKHKPSSLLSLQRSPYYWWWEYLRRNEDYKACCAAGGTGALAGLYADFGDIHATDFRSWWGGSQQKGAWLFGERQFDLRLLPLADKGDWADDWGDDWGGDIRVVAVNLSISRRKLQKDFADWLAKVHTGKRGRTSLSEVSSTARYPLHRNFSQHNLRAMLDVYDAWAANEQLPKGERKPLWAIGESLKLVPTAMPTKGSMPKDIVDKHNVMTNAVSRYVKQAKAIIANTAKGEFPNSKL